MTTLQSRHFQASQLRGVNRDARTVEIVASDFSLDSYGTRIDPAGWDLTQFTKNPVICLQHDSYSELPVAQALPETVRVENGKLVMTVQFPPEGSSDDSDEAFNLIAAGVLRGVSVGFDPEEWEDSTEQLPDGRQLTVRVYKKQRLMEVSFVTIPSNDNGLVVRAKELNADPKELKRRVERLEARLEANHGEPQVLVKKSVWDKYEGYFQRKQPANKAATKVLERFFKKVLKRDAPADEVAAWDAMDAAMDQLTGAWDALEDTRPGDTDELDEAGRSAKRAEPSPEPKTPETVTGTTVTTVEVKPEEPQPEPKPEDKKEETPPPPTPAPAEADPQPARKASVQIPVTVLMDFPAKLVKSYVDAATEALRRGVPIRDAVGMIDGMNSAVCNSLTHVSHGSNP